MRRRTAALLAVAAIALISLGVGSYHRTRSGRENDGAVQAGMVSDSVIQLEIRNGSGVAGLAADLSLILGRAGATAALLANAPHDHFEHSLLINRRLDDAVASALAERLGGLPVLLEFDSAAEVDMVLVLGADHVRVRNALLAGDHGR